MKSKTVIENQRAAKRDFDFFRLSKSKQEVDLSVNTIKSYNAQGLKLYRNGKSVFCSKSELELFIRLGPSAFKAAMEAR